MIEGAISTDSAGVIGVGSVSQPRSAQPGIAARRGELGVLPAACLQARRVFDKDCYQLIEAKSPFNEK